MCVCDLLLQDKLHQNIGRKRTLVAIGTHDLDTITAPFAYEALPKKDITFRPLAEEKEFDGEALFHYYNTRQPPSHLKPYLYITESSPVQPVIYDAKRVVCSLPPIINGEHSKITLQTKNVFIECTGTDATKLSVVLNQVVTMFSQYCSNQYEVEAVEVVNEATGKTEVFPQLENFPFTANVAYVNSAIGIDITAEAMVGYLKKMSMTATLAADGKDLHVLVPPTRSDILHACDIMEDIAISYGFNKVPRTLPQCYTQGKYNKLNSLSDSLRDQVAQAGFSEVLTWVLLSFDDNYRFMQPRDVKGSVLDIKAAQASAQAGSSASGLLEKQAPLVVHPLLATLKAITLANPKSLDFQLVRTTMLPGLLKALANNQGQINLPIRLFECGDIGFQSEDSDVGAKNQRRIG
jgi:phenylalanyl-tRNA synthetase beta chain